MKNNIIEIYSKYMMIVGIGGQMLFYCQAYKIFVTKNACGVSYQGFIIAFLSVASWLIYGVLKKDAVLILSNIAAVIGSILVLIGITLYS